MREYTTDTPVFRESIPIVEENDLVNEENDTAAAKQLLQNILVLMKTKVDMEIGKSLVSEDEREMWNGIYEQATGYVDLAISNMINGAPSTLDTLGEIAQAMRENDNVVDALDAAIGTKASQAEVDSHTGNNTIHITASERQTWNSKQSTTGDTKDNTVSFTSGDATNPTGWANVALIGSGETHSSLWRKVSLLFKNVRYIWKLMGNTSLSGIGDGTVTGAISSLNTGLEDSSGRIPVYEIWNGAQLADDYRLTNIIMYCNPVAGDMMLQNFPCNNTGLLLSWYNKSTLQLFAAQTGLYYRFAIDTDYPFSGWQKFIVQ